MFVLVVGQRLYPPLELAPLVAGEQVAVHEGDRSLMMCEVASHGEYGRGLMGRPSWRFEGDSATKVQPEQLKECEISSGDMYGEDELPPRAAVSEQALLDADSEAALTGDEPAEHPRIGDLT